MNSKKYEKESSYAAIMVSFYIIIVLEAVFFSAGMSALIIAVSSFFLAMAGSITGGLIRQGRLSDESCLKPNAIYEVMARGRDHLDSSAGRPWLVVVKTQDGGLLALRLEERPPDIFKFVNPRNRGKCYIHEFPPTDN